MTALAAPPQFRLDGTAILAALADPVIVVSADGQICYANPAAEQFFASGASVLLRMKLDDLVPFGSPLLTLVAQVQRDDAPVSEHSVDVSTPRIGSHLVNIQVSPLVETPGTVVVHLEERTIAHKMDRQLTHRGAARSVMAMAAVLAHEVKNPLSGIRGAAQLLEINAPPQDRELTRLICDETDRICALVDRMEVFSDKRPLALGPVNIHQVLEHVRKVAQNGFARHVRFTERYDPSLPPVLGNRDQLVQVFLNLVKNAAEAVPEQGGEILLTTAYRHGVRLAVPGSNERLHLPLEVCVQDNGPGVPEDLRQHMFDAFVTTKPNGSGLGLALVAKIIGDHGGIIECESAARRTVFRVLLSLHDSPERDTGKG
ncbi:MAG: PAS domain-containing protein [Alphaproteobacteria bacterium]|nr:PAS domain-containing protein [Alphaproteobacteria bacterium]